MENVDNYEQLSLYNPLDNTLDCKKRIDSTIKKKKRELKIYATKAFMEGDLIELPFISYTAKPNEIVTKVVWTDYKNNTRGITVKGSVDYGVPTPYEYDVLIALFRIYAKNKKILFNDDEFIAEIKKENLVITFSLNEVAREMGHIRPSGETLDRIKKSIKILTETTIYSHCDYGDNGNIQGGMYDATTKQYITSAETGFHIINSFESYSYKNNIKTNRKDIQKVYLGEFFYKNIKASYFKFFNYDKYKQINNSIGKKLYVMLNKWQNGRPKFEIGYEKLYEKIPLDTELSNSKKKEKIKLAAKCLQEIDYLASFNMGKDKIIFNYYNGESQTIGDRGDKQFAYQFKYNTFTEVKERLYAIGFIDSDIIAHLSFIVDNLAYVKALLRYSDVRNYHSQIDDLKGYVSRGLTEKYNLDDKYYDKSD